MTWTAGTFLLPGLMRPQCYFTDIHQQIQIPVIASSISCPGEEEKTVRDLPCICCWKVTWYCSLERGKGEFRGPRQCRCNQHQAVSSGTTGVWITIPPYSCKHGDILEISESVGFFSKKIYTNGGIIIFIFLWMICRNEYFYFRSEFQNETYFS